MNLYIFIEIRNDIERWEIQRRMWIIFRFSSSQEEGPNDYYFSSMNIYFPLFLIRKILPLIYLIFLIFQQFSININFHYPFLTLRFCLFEMIEFKLILAPRFCNLKFSIEVWFDLFEVCQWSSWVIWWIKIKLRSNSSTLSLSSLS